ncbi:MAG: GNAT family N-acetyltransferase [Acidimicrobiia bacterium]|nr:GNAT family N-acetyltransferase [Acidimicrobiia bacterium]
MTEPEPAPLIPLPRSECARAGAVLGKAFEDDPLWPVVLQESELVESLGAMFTAVTKATIAARGLAETNQTIEGVALWLPPGKDLGFWSMVRSGFVLQRFAMGLPVSDRGRLLAVLQQLEKRRRALLPGPHWYLSAVGVDPAWQRGGLGSRLVQAGIRRADEANVPIYLETQTKGNVEYYERRGFEVIEQITATGLGLPMWLMIRRTA